MKTPGFYSTWKVKDKIKDIKYIEISNIPLWHGTPGKNAGKSMHLNVTDSCLKQGT